MKKCYFAVGLLITLMVITVITCIMSKSLSVLQRKLFILILTILVFVVMFVFVDPIP